MNLIINEFFKNMTVEEVLKSFHLSKSNIYKLKSSSRVLVNGILMPFDSVVEFGDEMSIDLDSFEENNIVPSNKIVKIVYEDQDIVLLEKERGILIHSDGINNDTLLNRLAYYYSFKNEAVSLKVVHRIDVETTGLVLFAKNLLSGSYLSNLFENNDVTKKYIALVWGNVANDEGIISLPISGDRHSNKQRVAKKGLAANTEYKVLVRYKDKTLLDVKIIGGKKHQIRVHLENMGNPIVGDSLYGKQDKMEMMLKFYEIGFIHPTSREYFSYALPKNILKQAKK